MSDLIKREEVLKVIKEHFEKKMRPDDYMMWVSTDSIDMLVREIQAMPTAYDVDEVAEKLDRASDHYECEQQGREDVYMVDLTDAIDIVERGGVE